MAKATKNTKVLKTLRFLLGLRRPEAHGPQAPYGSTQAELEIAAQLVRAATEPELRKPNYDAVSPALLDKLDVIDNQWFAIIKDVLTRHSPDERHVQRGPERSEQRRLGYFQAFPRFLWATGNAPETL